MRKTLTLAPFAIRFWAIATEMKMELSASVCVTLSSGAPLASWSR